MIDCAVATAWNTTAFLLHYPHIRKRFYLVQNFETDFYEPNDPWRLSANQTYCFDYAAVELRTISRWCQNWLETDFGRQSLYAPNGLDTGRFSPIPRDFSGKIRILIEGNSNAHYKNVDESFAIVSRPEFANVEIWYVSYDGQPKSTYRFDRFFHQVPFEEMPEIYRQCHILLKSSLLESFSYPPLEMMATGGYVVAAKNDGIMEYARDGENCLLYMPGDLDAAAAALIRIMHDAALRERLYAEGLTTAHVRDWRLLTDDIVRLYQ
jgi:glycosyltransferase involved in cell wall biosynthesis